MASTNNSKSTFALYVGDLAPDVVELQLFETFGHIGEIVSVRVCRDLVTSKSLGYGYVNFASAENAEKALRQCNFTSIKGRPCRVMRSNPEPTKRRTGEGNLVVKNLSKEVTDREFFDFFLNFGAVLSSKISKEPSGESRGYGFVQFEKDEDTKKVLEQVANGTIPSLGSSKLIIEPFVNKSDRVKTEIPSTNLYLKNFPNTWTKEIIEEAFKGFGDLTSVHVTEDNKGRKFAFVNFATGEQATAALEAFNGHICKPEGGVKPRSEETEEEKSILPVEDTPLKKDEVEAEDKKEETPLAHRVYVSRAQSRTEREAALKQKFSSTTDVAAKKGVSEGVALYVKNLPETCTKEELHDLFAKHGEVADVYVAMAPGTKVSRGFGVVTMKDRDSATRAVGALSAYTFHGKPLHVCPHQKKEERARIVQEQQMSLAAATRVAPTFQNAQGYQQHQNNNQRFNNRNNQNYQNNVRNNQNPAANAQQQQQRFPAAPHPAAMNPMMSYQMMMQQQQRAPTLRTIVLNLEENQRRDYLGNLLFPRIAMNHATEAAKITGMILEMDVSEIIDMLESQEKLAAKVREALQVLENAKIHA
eukprot:GDKJ01018501.1.p2 GENE.GDKJ01018501.1~~GDKJ01018501.1.p2  ORF type:complete len:588 (-),score=209.70 GDKJ01018501.1:347-2110(-)